MHDECIAIPHNRSFLLQGHKSHKAYRDALIEAGKTTDKVSMVFAEVDGNEGALDFFGIKAKVRNCLWRTDSAGAQGVHCGVLHSSRRRSRLR